MTNKENLIIFGSIGLAATVYNSLRLAYIYGDEDKFSSNNYNFEQAKNRVLFSTFYHAKTVLTCSLIPFLTTQVISEFTHLAAELPLVLSSQLKLPRFLAPNTQIAPQLSKVIRNSSTVLQCAGFAMCLTVLLAEAANLFHHKFLGATEADIVIKISEDPKTNKIENKFLLTNLALSSALACGLAYYGKLAR